MYSVGWFTFRDWVGVFVALFLTTRPGNEGFAPTVDSPSPQIERSSQTADAGTTTDGPFDDKTGVRVENINARTTGNEDDKQTITPTNDEMAVIDEETDAVHPLAAGTEDASHILHENVIKAAQEDSPPIVEIKIPSLSQHTSSEDLRLSNPNGQETPREPCLNQTIVRAQAIKCVSHGIQGMHNDESSEEDFMINANQSKEGIKIVPSADQSSNSAQLMDSSVSISSDSQVIKSREKLRGYHNQNHDSSDFQDNQGESTENEDDSFEQDNYVENNSFQAVPDDFEEYHEGDEPGEHEESGPTKTDDLSIDDPPVDSSDSSSSPSSSNDGTSSDNSSIPSSNSSMRDYSSSSDSSDGAMTNDISGDSDASSNSKKSESPLISSGEETGSDSSTTEADQMEEDSVNATNTPTQSRKVNHPT